MARILIVEDEPDLAFGLSLNFDVEGYETIIVHRATDAIERGREGEIEPRVPFATALRSLLRQDPDILLIGEIRDRETAEIAAHAALTGHLVFSTLHTNDATSAVTRLMNMGLAPYLIAATLQAVVAQRLVRRTCSECRDLRKVNRTRILALTGSDSEKLCESAGRGCPSCHGSGFRGRAAVYELLIIDDLRAAIEQAQPKSCLDALAVQSGMLSLRDHAIELIAAGVTTAAEAVRVLGRQTRGDPPVVDAGSRPLRPREIAAS